MDDFDFKFKNAKVSALKQLYGDLKPEFQDGGSVETPKRGLVDEPGSYGGGVSKSLGGGLYETTYKKGSKAYYTKIYDRETGKDIKKSFGSDKKAATESLKKQKADRPKTKFEKIKEVKETKGIKEFEKITNEIDNKFSKIESKGYTNLREFRDEIKNLVTKDKFRNQIQIQNKINGYITDKFKDIQDVNTSSMEKALDKYNKAGGKERGTIGKIANEFGINKNTFELNIQKTGRKTIPIKYGSEYEKRKAVKEKRTAAEKKFSDLSFESKMSGSAEVQKSHMDDLYSRVVRADTLGYAPARINQEILKDADAYLSSLYKKRDKLLKDKPEGYKQAVEEINQKGIKVAQATDGYKSFQIEQPNGTKYQFGVEPGKTIDPAGILEGKEVKGNVEKVQFKPQTVVTEQLEGPDKGKITKEKFGAKKETATLTSDPVNQFFFEKNREAVMESQSKVPKNKIKSIENTLNKVLKKGNPLHTELMKFCPKAKSSGGPVGTCSINEAANGLQKELNVAAKTKNYSKVGKAARLGGAFFGWVDAPIELAFALPGLLKGDKNEALRNTTLGLFGAGETEFDQLEPGTVLYKRAKDVKDVQEYLNNFFEAEDLKSYLDKTKDFASNPKVAEQRKFYQERFDTLIQNTEKIIKEYEPTTLAEQVQARKDLREKEIASAKKGLTIPFIDINFAPYGKPKDLSNIEDYIKYKGDPFYKAYEVAGEELAIDPSLQNNFYEKDIRDRFSDLPLNLTSELGSFEKLERDQLLKKKIMGGPEVRKSLLEEQGIDPIAIRNTRLAGGGIAKLAGVDSGPAPEKGPTPQGLASIIKRGRKY